MWTYSGSRVFHSDQRSGHIGDYCNFCMDKELAKHDIYYTDDIECDMPLHCCLCHRPLTSGLTADSLFYVLDQACQKFGLPDLPFNLNCWHIDEYTDKLTIMGVLVENLPKLDVSIMGHWRKDQYWYDSPDYAIIQNWLEQVRYMGSNQLDLLAYWILDKLPV